MMGGSEVGSLVRMTDLDHLDRTKLEHRGSWRGSVGPDSIDAGDSTIQIVTVGSI
jgi:hypothetical protein